MLLSTFFGPKAPGNSFILQVQHVQLPGPNMATLKMVPVSVKPFSEKNMFGGSCRNYDSSTHQDKVEKTYADMHSKQTVAFVKSMHEKWMKFDR